METSFGCFVRADAEVCKKLNKTIREPQDLTVCKDQLLRFTVNSKKEYSQGQICKVVKINYHEGTPISINVIVAKPGTSDFEDNSKVMELNMFIYSL